MLYLFVLGVLSILPVFMFIAVFSLWIFHIYIGFLQVSTYNWILGKRDSNPPSIEMPKPPSQRQTEELQARRQEVYEQWLRQNRLRQLQKENGVQASLSNNDVKIEVRDPGSPQSHSESIFSQVEEVLGIDIHSVNEGQPMHADAMSNIPAAAVFESADEGKLGKHLEESEPADPPAPDIPR